LSVLVNRQPIALSVTHSHLLHEGLRVVAAFCLYVALRPAWSLTGLGDLYGRVIRAIVGSVLLRTQHFQVLGSLDGVSIANLDHLVVFAISLFIVSGQARWTLRIRRFVIVMLFIILVHVVTAFLSVKLKMAQELIQQQQLRILLPWEFRMLDNVKFLIYDLGLQVGPFVLMILSVAWNEMSKVDPRHVRTSDGARTPKRRRNGRLSLRERLGRSWFLRSSVVLVALILGGAVWHRWRESQPLHVAAHARLGQIYLEHGSLLASEKQYRIAVAGGSNDPEVFYNLAEILRRRGARAESERLLRRGRLMAGDTNWRRRFEKALAPFATPK
jgi:hypothetical protein